MTLNTDVVDGVPVFWLDLPGPLAAELIFRAGVRDETFMTAGITHLAEHLIMAQASDGRDATNAMVEPSMTTFSTSGRPETVVAFLSALCAAISSPSFERLPVEKKVLEAEAGSVVNPAVSRHLRRRFGVRSLGLTDVAPHGLRLIDEEAVRNHIRTYFTQQNAVLVLSGPPPQDLRLPLPSGEPRTPVPAPRVDLPYPMWFEQDGPQLSLSFELPVLSDVETEGVFLLSSLIRRRVIHELRHSKGWIYEVDIEPVLDIDGRGILCVLTDPPAHHVDDVLAGLLRILRSMSERGPSTLDIEDSVRELQEYLDDPGNAMDEAIAAARNHLMNYPALTAIEKMELVHRVAPETCKRVLTLLEGTLVVGMPEGCFPVDESLVAEHARHYPAIRGERFRRGLRGAVTGVPARAQLVVGDAGVSFSDGVYCSILWNDVEVLEELEPGLITLTSSTGLSIDLSATWFSQGSRAIQMIREKVPTAKVIRAE